MAAAAADRPARLCPRACRGPRGWDGGWPNRSSDRARRPHRSNPSWGCAGIRRGGIDDCRRRRGDGTWTTTTTTTTTTRVFPIGRPRATSWTVAEDFVVGIWTRDCSERSSLGGRGPQCRPMRPLPENFHHCQWRRRRQGGPRGPRMGSGPSHWYCASSRWGAGACLPSSIDTAGRM